MSGISESGIITLRRVMAPLADEPLFLAWTPGTPDPVTGKFPKYPIGQDGNRLVGWQNPAAHITLNEAIARAQRYQHKSVGVGIALHPEPVATDCDGVPVYLVALDIDNCVHGSELSRHWQTMIDGLGSYAEISPSGNGIRILAFTTEAFRTQRVKRVDVSLEVFGATGFVTLTGNVIHDAPIQIRNQGIKTCREVWFADSAPYKPASRSTGKKKALTLGGQDFGALKETPINIGQVRQWLGSIGQVNDRDGWRDIIWSVLGLKWDCSESLAHEWASTHCRGYEHCWERGFANVISSFSPGRAPGWLYLRDTAHEAMNANSGRSAK